MLKKIYCHETSHMEPMSSIIGRTTKFTNNDNCFQLMKINGKILDSSVNLFVITQQSKVVFGFQQNQQFSCGSISRENDEKMEFRFSFY